MIDWFFFYSIYILVYIKVSLYNEIWVKKAHQLIKIGSLQGCPFIKLGSDKTREINIKWYDIYIYICVILL